MPTTPEPVGILFVSIQVLQLEKWLVDQVISASMMQMKKYKRLDGFLTPSPVRVGDFSLILAEHRLDPIIATFIGIPGMLKPPIIEELFVAG